MSDATEAIPSYLDVAAADALAPTLHGLSAWASASDADKLAALATATARLDSLRWQGRRLDAAQPLAFPRVPYDGREVWGRDRGDGTHDAPLAVRQACLLEADALLAGRAAVLARRDAGLLSQSAGPVSESYAAIDPLTGLPALCESAALLIRRYRLRTGRIL